MDPFRFHDYEWMEMRNEGNDENKNGEIMCNEEKTVVQGETEGQIERKSHVSIKNIIQLDLI